MLYINFLTLLQPDAQPLLMPRMLQIHLLIAFHRSTWQEYYYRGFDLREVNEAKGEALA